MVKKFFKTLFGSIRWMLYVIILAAVLLTFLAAALIATPVVFVILWRASTIAEGFDKLSNDLADKVADWLEANKDKLNINIEVNEDDEEVFPRL